MFFESIGSQGEQLEPKWHSHFGNYIVNTLLALHKFQAKKQIYSQKQECAFLLNANIDGTWHVSIKVPVSKKQSSSDLATLSPAGGNERISTNSYCMRLWIRIHRFV